MLGYPLVLGFDGFVGSVVAECVGVPTGFWVLMVLWVFTCGMCWGIHWFGF